GNIRHEQNNTTPAQRDQQATPGRLSVTQAPTQPARWTPEWTPSRMSLSIISKAAGLEISRTAEPSQDQTWFDNLPGISTCADVLRLQRRAAPSMEQLCWDSSCNSDISGPSIQ
ncbi:MAG: hypothetical protein ACYCO9_12660, partial [Streptosporangiaceae bacterium]